MEVEADLSAAIEKNPNFADAWLARGGLRIDLARPAEALSDCEQGERLGGAGVIVGFGLSQFTMPIAPEVCVATPVKACPTARTSTSR